MKTTGSGKGSERNYYEIDWQMNGNLENGSNEQGLLCTEA